MFIRAGYISVSRQYLESTSHVFCCSRPKRVISDEPRFVFLAYAAQFIVTKTKYVSTMCLIALLQEHVGLLRYFVGEHKLEVKGARSIENRRILKGGSRIYRIKGVVRNINVSNGCEIYSLV